MTNGLLLLVLGAIATCLYLNTTLDTPLPEIDRLTNLLYSTGLLLLVVSGQVSEVNQKPLTTTQARSGVVVVIGTGLCAAVALSWGFERWTDLIIPALVVPTTILIAWLVYRFASINEGQIGEARFVTSHDDGAGASEPTR